MQKQNASRRLSGKVVVVTGASSGIGLLAAHELGAEGAHVVLAARRKQLVDDEVRRLESAGVRALALSLDVTSDDSVRRAVELLERELGGVDVLINNAGNGGELRLWAESDPEAFRAQFDVHVFGTERVSRALLPLLRRRGGTIVNVASTVAWVPMPGAAAYCAAKAAVVAFTDVLRAELAREGIAVRLFAPPHTSTEAGKAWPLDLPKIFAPEWVAEQLVDFVCGRDRRAVVGGNAALLWLQRIWPRAAARIMERLGFAALAKARSLHVKSAGPAGEARDGIVSAR